MRFFLALVAVSIVGAIACSKTKDVSDGALGGNWSTGCIPMTAGTSSTDPLSQKITFTGLAQSSPSTAAITTFTDTACTSTYSSAVYTFTGMEAIRGGSNHFTVPLKLTSVSFVAHTSEALAKFSRDAKSKNPSFDDRSITVGASFDATDKTESYTAGDVTCNSYFQYNESPDVISEKQVQLSCTRAMNEKFGIVIIPSAKFLKN